MGGLDTWGDEARGIEKRCTKERDAVRIDVQ